MDVLTKFILNNKWVKFKKIRDIIKIILKKLLQYFLHQIIAIGLIFANIFYD